MRWGRPFNIILYNAEMIEGLLKKKEEEEEMIEGSRFLIN
jgi:hypothetical protein